VARFDDTAFSLCYYFNINNVQKLIELIVPSAVRDYTTSVHDQVDEANLFTYGAQNFPLVDKLTLTCNYFSGMGDWSAWDKLQTIELDTSDMQSNPVLTDQRWPDMPSLKNASFKCVPLETRRFDRHKFCQIVVGFLAATKDLRSLVIRTSFQRSRAHSQDDAAMIALINERHATSLNTLELPGVFNCAQLNVTCRVFTLQCYSEYVDRSNVGCSDLDLSGLRTKEMVVQGSVIVWQTQFCLPSGLEILRFRRPEPGSGSRRQQLGFNDSLFARCESSLKILDLGVYEVHESGITALTLDEIHTEWWETTQIIHLIRAAKEAVVYVNETRLNSDVATALVESYSRGLRGVVHLDFADAWNVYQEDGLKERLAATHTAFDLMLRRLGSTCLGSRFEVDFECKMAGVAEVSLMRRSPM
jgi:hypothetical protein